MKKFRLWFLTSVIFLSFANAQIKKEQAMPVIKTSTPAAKLINTAPATMIIHENGNTDDVRTNLEVVWYKHKDDCNYTLNIKSGKKNGLSGNDNVELNLNLYCKIFSGFDYDGKSFSVGAGDFDLLNYGELTGNISNYKNPNSAEKFSFSPKDHNYILFTGEGIIKNKLRFVSVKSVQPVILINSKTGGTKTISLEFKNLQIPNQT